MAKPKVTLWSEPPSVAPERRFRPLSGGVLGSKVSSILMDGEGMTAWSIWATRNIFASTMGAMSLFRKGLISMVLKVFGVMQRQGSVGFVV
jgi:hypothetical protein